MTHLTQVMLDFATAARLGLRDSYQWHRAVWKAFPGRDAGPREFLTRLDVRREGFRLLIVSTTAPSRPDWCPLNEGCWKTTIIPPTYFSRPRYAFQLCANPTRKVVKELGDGIETKNGRRVSLVTREQLVEWIDRKGLQGGFAVDKPMLRTYSRGREYFHKQGCVGLHNAVEFEGILTVTDQDKFFGTFMHGIGSAKAFGFGLLVIAPAPQGKAVISLKGESE